jgi:glycosyltransferase involved in cell wall biosynthesis
MTFVASVGRGKRKSGFPLAVDSTGGPCYVRSAMKIAALLPHVEVFGGVRRYLELGNEFVSRGHTFVLFHPEGVRPSWLEFQGEVRPLSALEAGAFDIGLCSEYSILSWFEKLRAGLKYFYFVLEGHTLERDVVRRPFHFLGNSEGLCRRLEKRYGISCFRAAGGVNPILFHPMDRETSAGDEFSILCYGRILRKRKGVQHVIRAANGLSGRIPGLKLLFFDTLVGRDKRDPRPLIRTSLPYEFYLDLPQSRMAWLYSRADIFVSAERRAGWANTAAEAMACRLPVVCTASGTRDFAVNGETALVVPAAHPYFLRRAILRLVRDPGLRARLAEAGLRKISGFTWDALAARLEAHFQADLGSGSLLRAN